jgi:hypothetical protein
VCLCVYFVSFGFFSFFSFFFKLWLLSFIVHDQSQVFCASVISAWYFCAWDLFIFHILRSAFSSSIEPRLEA